MSLQTVEINLANLRHNIKNLKSLVKPDVRFMAVVKSNAYGHGLTQIAKSAIEFGANWLGVVTIDEGLKIREARIGAPVLVLGYPEWSQIQNAAQKGIAVPVITLAQAEKLANFKLTYPLVVHLKVETGINRLGLQKNEAIKAYELLKKNPKILVEGIYSHFASVEEEDIEYSEKQIKKFDEILKEFTKKKIDIKLKHLSATSGTMILPKAHYNMVRCGIGIYGLWPSLNIKKRFLKDFNKTDDFLKPILSYKTEIVQSKDVKKGEAVGYGCTYKTQKNMKIGVIPVGYYEGVDRELSNKGEVIINEKKCPIIGRICMNMSVIDITQIRNSKSEIRNNNEVIIIGRQGKEEILADDVAKKVGTINYEIVTRIPEHITKIYRL